MLDGENALQNVREELSGDWTKCGLLGGTQPRPDYAYGLSSAAFTEDERVGARHCFRMFSRDYGVRASDVLAPPVTLSNGVAIVDKDIAKSKVSNVTYLVLDSPTTQSLMHVSILSL